MVYFFVYLKYFFNNVFIKKVLIVLFIYIMNVNNIFFYIYFYKIILLVDNYCFIVDEVIMIELDGKLFYKFYKCVENIDVIFFLCFYYLIE